MKLVPAAIGSLVGLTQPLRDNFKLQSTVIHLLIRISILLVKLQGGWSGWPTGNGKKVSNSQACCLAQLCLAAA